MREVFLVAQGLQVILLLSVIGVLYFLWRGERNRFTAQLSKSKKNLALQGDEKFIIEDIIRELDHKSLHLFLLFNAGKNLNSTLNFSSLVKNINETFIEVISSQGGCLFTQSEDKNIYRLVSSTPSIEAAEFTLNSELLEFLSKSKEPLAVEEFKKLEYGFSQEFLHFCEQTHIQTCIPIVYSNQVLALQALMPKISQDSLTTPEKELLSTLAVLAANALQNSILFDISMYDGLTKIHNYRYFRRRLMEEFRRSRRYHSPLSLVMFDLDSFKNFNDTYGHQKGDEVLYEIAQLAANSLRKDIDIAARYGGEEFAVILPETRYKDALTVADRLRMLVEKYPFQGSYGKNVNITISLGVAGYPEFPLESFEDLIGLADKALYQAKGEGKNRVCGAGIPSF